MKVDESALGLVVKMKYGDGSIRGIAEVLSYCSVPSVEVVTAEGAHSNWRADFCDIAEPQTAEDYWQSRATYWQQRAEKAEKP